MDGKAMNKPRPPLGVMSLRLWREAVPDPDLDDLLRRYRAVDAAVARAREAKVAPLRDWLVELGLVAPERRGR